MLGDTVKIVATHYARLNKKALSAAESSMAKANNLSAA
jgi:hypothetical protein